MRVNEEKKSNRKEISKTNRSNLLSLSDDRFQPSVRFIVLVFPDVIEINVDSNTVCSAAQFRVHHVTLS